MKKWQNLAAPDDPDSYFDVDGVWPTKAGTYETCDFLSGTEIAATGAANPTYAWTGQTLSSTREYVVDNAAIWQYSGGALTDRTGGVTFTSMMFAQFGDVTIGATGTGTSTIKSTGGNFSALAGAPNALIVVTQSNAVLCFNTNTAANGWAASDVGDYTNWTTGEAASGTLYQTPGQITGAVAFGNDVIVFKENAIYRMRYVGGVVKWTAELLVNGIGCLAPSSACVGRNGILFMYQAESSSNKRINPTWHMYYFDGVSYPRLVNSMLAMTPLNELYITYDPMHDLFTMTDSNSASPYDRTYFYSPQADMWGKNTTPITNTQTARALPVVGDFAARVAAEKSPQPVLWNKESANKLKRYSHGTPMGEIASSCYVETMKVGTPGRKTAFIRATPILRRRVDLGTESATATLTLFTEREDTTASTTRSGIAESTPRRYDFSGGVNVDGWGRVKVTWTAFDVEIDDVLVETKDAGQS